ncbi:MAG: uncharacterized protein K0R34_181 [Herbinix sp.]|jgi:uncharacterized phosphosugar-binding protein|nr:uncharacterized protein [Herbinix sp.]
MGKERVEEYAFLPKLCALLQEVESLENDAMEAAAKAAFTSIQKGGLLHVFATGHSLMIVEEMFFRSGGLVPVNPIVDQSLTIQDGAVQSMMNERKSGLAEQILAKVGLKKGDTIIISSNSGINNVPIEAAIYAREIGLTVVGITSLKASSELETRHMSGKKLYEYCDIVIDNHVPIGDGLLSIPENGLVTGGASSFSSLFIAQKIILKIENYYLAEDQLPPVYRSANIPGGTEYNAELIASYQDKIKLLR